MSIRKGFGALLLTCGALGAESNYDDYRGIRVEYLSRQSELNAEVIEESREFAKVATARNQKGGIYGGLMGIGVSMLCIGNKKREGKE
jgi:hypothetical protein